ncbi:MAG: hypothetical protein II191_04200 [Clostridia bacterium]|nr:hypothetical protein [Clostridia bacterium]
MTDVIWIITSSVLILAVFAIRAIFGKKLSAGLRYALWAIVLVRLLIPGTVLSSPVSVHGAAESTEIVQNFEAVRGVDAIAYTEAGSIEGVTRRAVSPAQPEVPPAPSHGTAPTSPTAPAAPAVVTSTLVEQATPQRFTRMQTALKLRDILNYCWLIGMGLFTLFFVFTNVRFYLRLRSRRKRLDIECPVPVYSVEKLESSCFFLRSIYVSAPTAAQADRLRCVMEHELAHRRHGDQIFALLRSVALILHWYNPLVWLAALLSRRDSELFADAGAIARLGEAERENYGMTLIELSALRPINAPILSAATTMANGKRELKNRITHIAKKRRMSFAIAAAVLLAVAAAVFFTFAGCKSPEGPGADVPDVKVTTAPMEEPTEDPTEQPTKEPFPYDEHDYTALRDFFEAADENGVRNGEKLFADYDPEDPGTWLGQPGYHEINTEIKWTGKGKLKELTLAPYSDDLNTVIELAGSLDLSGMDELMLVRLWSMVFDDLTVSADPKLGDLRMWRGANTRNRTIVDLELLPAFDLCSRSRCLVVYSGGPIDGKPFDFTIDLTAEGDGSVGVWCTGSPGNELNLGGGAAEGMYCDGFYDANGERALEYSEGHYSMNPNNPEGLEGEFVYTVRFLPADPGNTENVRIIPKESELFTEEEIAEAIEVVLADFRKDWWGCTLTEIGYAGDDAVRAYQPYSPWTNGERMILLISTFTVTGPGADAALGPVSNTWSDWNWILIQQEDGSWVHVDHGY